MLAGCTHACAMVSLLLHRLLQRVRRFRAVPRALVDDVTRARDKLRIAVARFREGAKELGIIIQTEKSGYVTSSTAVAQRRRLRGGARGLAGKRRVRNLGHDLCGRRKVRRQAAERMRALAARRGRLLLFEKTVGRRAACL